MKLLIYFLFFYNFCAVKELLHEHPSFNSGRIDDQPSESLSAMEVFSYYTYLHPVISNFFIINNILSFENVSNDEGFKKEFLLVIDRDKGYAKSVVALNYFFNGIDAFYIFYKILIGEKLKGISEDVLESLFKKYYTYSFSKRLGDLCSFFNKVKSFTLSSDSCKGSSLFFSKEFESLDCNDSKGVYVNAVNKRLCNNLNFIAFFALIKSIYDNVTEEEFKQTPKKVIKTILNEFIFSNNAVVNDKFVEELVGKDEYGNDKGLSERTFEFYNQGVFSSIDDVEYVLDICLAIMKKYNVMGKVFMVQKRVYSLCLNFTLQKAISSKELNIGEFFTVFKSLESSSMFSRHYHKRTANPNTILKFRINLDPRSEELNKAKEFWNPFAVLFDKVDESMV